MIMFFTFNSSLKMFKPYSRTKTQLGKLYFPDAEPADARRHLMRWVNGCHPLLDTLHALGYRPRQHYFTTAQVVEIVRHLGPPEEI